jgi:hypothetical protein
VALPPLRQADAALGMLAAAGFGCAALTALLGLKPLALFGLAVVVLLLRARGALLPAALAACGGAVVLPIALAVMTLVLTAAGMDWRWTRWDDVILYPAAVGLGWVAGVGISERWTFGRVFGIVTVPAGGLVLAGALVRWEQWHAVAADSFQMLRQVYEQPATGVNPEQATAALRALEWQLENWAYISLGMAFAVLALMVAATLGVVSRVLWTLYRMPGPSLGFREMRPPDWLVWPVILLAVAALADWHRPELHLRPVAWNGLIALGAVYWLNGVSLVWHALVTFKAHPFVFVAAVVMLAIPQLRLAVVMMGLFDTWYEFRRRFELLARLRQARRESE